jgi:hypothetical protein
LYVCMFERFYVLPGFISIKKYKRGTGYFVIPGPSKFDHIDKLKHIE